MMDRSVWKVVAALVTTVLMVLTIGAPRGRAATVASAAPSFTVERLADGVFALVRTDLPGLLVNSNVLFIVNDEDVVVVDTNYTPASAEASLAALRAITPKPVRYVVNTHWHTDHSSGNQVYRQAFPQAEIVGHPATREDLARRGAETARQWAGGFPGLAADLRRALDTGKTLGGGPLSAAERASYESDLRIAADFVAGAGALQVTPPTLTVEEGFVLHRGERTIEIRALGRGHTRGDLVVWLPKEGIVATGDLVVAPVPLIGADQSYIGDWGQTLGHLLDLHPKIVVPGHGPVLRDDGYVKLFRDFLLAVDSQARAAVARGETLEQAQAALRFEGFRDRMAGEDAELRFLFSVYGAKPAVGAVYREAGPKKP